MKLLIVSSYPPRKCGIATFTQDLMSHLHQQDASIEIGIVALGDGTVGYNEEVVHIIEHHNEASYHQAAQWINASGYDVLVIEHEYGLYGDHDGQAVLVLAKESKLPVITTLHTILSHPSPQQHDILASLCRYSTAVVTMANNSKSTLHRIYGVPREKVHVIHHGVPSHENYPTREDLKQKYEIEGRTVISTFGLLSEGKGIEYGIQAMVAVAQKHPEVLYIIAGQTHPVVKEKEGEKYRQRLEQIVKTQGLADNVRFIDRYFSQEDLVRLLLLSDIYMTPYLAREQAVSGTLAYAAGCGKAIVSTAYPYAKELLSEGRGVVADFADVSSLEKAVLSLLDHPDKRIEMEKKMSLFGRDMTWTAVACRYKELFSQVIAQKKLLSERPSHRCLLRMSDETGIFQHGFLTIPDRKKGYTTDDNVRALYLSCLRYKETQDSETLYWIRTYLSFVVHAQKEGTFRNFMGYHHTFLEEQGSQDCFGRCLCILGTLSVVSWLPSSITEVCDYLFEQSFASIQEISALRSKAYIIIGLAQRNRRKEDDVLNTLAHDLVASYKQCTTTSWHWFEDEMTYCNALLPRALFVAYQRTGNEDFLTVATQSAQFLINLTVQDDVFVPIGCKGWYKKGSIPARYDQQPVEAAEMILLCHSAYALTHEERYKELLQTCFDWFIGKNTLGLILVDPEEGGCYDGLEPHGLNHNQGAESILSWQLSWFVAHNQYK